MPCIFTGRYGNLAGSWVDSGGVGLLISKQYHGDKEFSSWVLKEDNVMCMMSYS